jgi:hypothetical protein
MTTLKTYVINAATAAAVSLAAITSGPAPAAADDKDLLKVLAGIAAVAIFAGVIDQQNRAPVTRNQPLPVQPVVPAWQQPRMDWQADTAWKQQGWHDNRRANRDDRGGPRLPAACALEFGNGPRPATYYAEACLRREGVAYGLPQYCAQQIRSRDYQGRVFEGECLLDAGYRLERWR